MTRLPNGTTSLVLCTRAHGTAVIAAGPNTRASYKQVGAVPFYTRFVFHPGCARIFFGVPIHELADRVVGIDDLWGTRTARLRTTLQHSEGQVEGTIRALESALVERLDTSARARSTATLLRRAVTAFESVDAGEERVHAVARDLRVGERQLRQLFREEIGISPKRYARIARIRHAVARAGTAGWARVAVETGFYDQAHLASEFRKLLGVSPSAFLAGDLPLDATCEANGRRH